MVGPCEAIPTGYAPHDPSTVGPVGLGKLLVLVDEGPGQCLRDAQRAYGKLLKGSFILQAGTYQLDIDVVRLAAGGGSIGSGYIRVTSVPVPAALWLFGSGIAALGWFRRRSL